VNRALTSLKRFFSWAVEQHLLRSNPAQVVKWVPEEATAPPQLTDQQEDDLLAAVLAGGNLRDRTLITLMLHTGLRAGEVCALRRDQIVLQKRSGSVQVRGKRNKTREVPLNATARAVLVEYLRTLPAAATYLFASERTGTALTERALGHLIAKYARQAHLHAVSPHTLRHRFGYRMAQIVPLHRLAQIMGHDSLDTTLLYIKATPADLQQEVEKIAWT
jgi:integrase/recombinase XerC